MLLEGFINRVLVKMLTEDFTLKAFSKVHYYTIIFTSGNEIFVSFIWHDKGDSLNLTVLKILTTDFLHHIAQIMECFLFLDELF